MRLSHLCLVMLLVSGSAVWAQQKPSLDQEPQQQKPSLGQERSEERPSLGKQPSLSGPRSSTTTDARKLMRIRTIFVERIDNLLSEKLVNGLSKTGRFRIVANRNQADAVLRGTCFDSRRLKTVHSEVYISERGNGASIWQDSVRRRYNPPPLDKVVDDTAVLILGHLTESLQEAQRK